LGGERERVSLMRVNEDLEFLDSLSAGGRQRHVWPRLLAHARRLPEHDLAPTRAGKDEL
jgi:hypothetical protein